MIVVIILAVTLCNGDNILDGQAKDLQGVKAYQELDIDGLCTLGTVVIDYRGYRITAQSIIPGTSLSYYTT